MKRNKIVGDKKYFTIIPNIIDDMGLSIFAVRLYLRIARRAGQQGTCWESTNNLATGCGMSKSSVVKAKRELQKAGLITITECENPGGGRKYHEIRLESVWEYNQKFFSKVQI